MQQAAAGLQVIKAIADIVREVGEVPAGHLYSAVMGVMDLDRFQHIVDVLVGSKLIRKQGDLLTWVGPK